MSGSELSELRGGYALSDVNLGKDSNWGVGNSGTNNIGIGNGGDGNIGVNNGTNNGDQ